MNKNLKEGFLTPPDEFTPIPFWFWNDKLSEKEIARQMDDFQDKGVMGFVIHPRKGIPKEIPYLSDIFMHYAEYAVKEAYKRNMRVVLYDEAMYPSGSAHGLLVKENPEYAARALRMEERKDSVRLPELEERERIAAVVAVEKDKEGRVLPETLEQIELSKEVLQAAITEEKSLLYLIEGYSGGTIRGIHSGEDDGEPNAPAAGDLLNPEAMQAFIRITYERYYEVLKPYFGKTVIAMFTDEPCVLGRCPRSGCMPWTAGFDKYIRQSSIHMKELPLLWLEAADGSQETVRRQFQKAVNQRLGESYYRQISGWCKEHHIALTGHPARSDDMGALKYFHIPGQDVVWRWLAPENDSRIVGADSTMGKCSSDAARHYGRRRNSNECFGCCGPNEINWSFAPDDMKWYLDWLFVRGVNLLYPHAFFYSVDGEERFGERPPDVGPNNTFWPYYQQVADYIKRMSWLMTDSYNTTPIAVLCEEDHLPWEPARELFCNQIEFNYLEDNLLVSDKCRITEGMIRIEKQKYRVLLADSREIKRDKEMQERLSAFAAQGGSIIYWDQENGLTGRLEEFREIRMVSCCSAEDIRISHVRKEDTDFFLLVNEGKDAFDGMVDIPYSSLKNRFCHYRVQQWDAWKGTQESVPVTVSQQALHLYITLERRESLILCLEECPCIDLSGCFELGDWTEQTGRKSFSGTVTYEAEFTYNSAVTYGTQEEPVILDLGEVHEIAAVKVNGRPVGVRMWAPYRFNIGEALKDGENIIQIDVTNTPANKFENAKVVSGLLGPVRVYG